jgi:hypothetical protein
MSYFQSYTLFPPKAQEKAQCFWNMWVFSEHIGRCVPWCCPTSCLSSRDKGAPGSDSNSSLITESSCVIKQVAGVKITALFIYSLRVLWYVTCTHIYNTACVRVIRVSCGAQPVIKTRLGAENIHKMCILLHFESANELFVSACIILERMLWHVLHLNYVGVWRQRRL